MRVLAEMKRRLSADRDHKDQRYAWENVRWHCSCRGHETSKEAKSSRGEYLGLGREVTRVVRNGVPSCYSKLPCPCHAAKAAPSESGAWGVIPECLSSSLWYRVPGFLSHEYRDIFKMADRWRMTRILKCAGRRWNCKLTVKTCSEAQLSVQEEHAHTKEKLQ